MKYIFSILVLALFFIPKSWSQTLNAYEKAADDAFEKQDYYNAVYYYELVLKSREKPAIFYRYGDACRLSHAYKKAETAYKKVIDSEERSRFEKLNFYYAVTLKHNGKYDEAAKYFEQFSKSGLRDEYYQKKAVQELISCELAKIMVENPDKNISLKRLGDNINTEFSDFGAHQFQDSGLIYSSLRFDRKQLKDEKPDAKRLISRLQFAKDETSNAKDIAVLNALHAHSANSCFSPDESRIYFTRCSGENSDSVICKIYFSRILANDKWSNPVELIGFQNYPNNTFTQPNIALQDGIECIYFVSDMPGGKGKNDIWQAKLENDSTVMDFENLGASINTIDHEASPFFYAKKNRLYFASQWHLGLGGYDIFYADLKDGKFSEPVNPGVPTNSAANDFYWAINSDDSTGYFASNRSGSLAITEESCCNDIYKFTLSEKLIKDSIPLPLDTLSIVSVNVEKDSNSITKIEIPEFVPERTVEDLNKMLPIKLYFHNDEPDSNVTVSYTLKPYSEPYSYYISLQPVYVAAHSAQYSGENRLLAEKKVNDFFENEVKFNYSKMNSFFDSLLVFLAKGEKMEIQIRGFTSPRSYNAYNQALGNRRVMSLKNQILQYKSAAFLPFINSGTFVIKELSFGETQVPAGVNDRMSDTRNSIFSVEASRERRVEIVFLNSTK
jgi:hypothetical protein